MGNRGSITVYWLIVILIVIEAILFAINITSKNHILASSKSDFLEEKIYIENLSEQTKYMGYKLVEDTAIYAKDYTEYRVELLGGEVSDEEIEAIYSDSLDIYSNRELTLSNESGDIKFGARDKLRLQGYPQGYILEDMTVRARIVDEIELDDGKKRYKMVYDYCELKGGTGYLSTPIVVELTYPSYHDIISENMEKAVRVYVGNNYESQK